jgi:hypothetical protein
MNKRWIGILIIATLFIAGMLEGCARHNLLFSDAGGTPSIDQAEKTIAVVVKTKELDLVDFKTNNKVTTLDSGGMFSHPVISLDKSYIAYLKDTVLYVTTLQGEKTKVLDNAPLLSYTWFDKNHLLYSAESGGIYIYDTEKKASQPYVKNEFHYENITVGAAKQVYAEKYRYYMKNTNKYIQDYGVVLFPPDTGKEQLIIPSIPSDDQQNSLGMYPVIAGISGDFRFLYIFEHPHSGSMAADGLSLASYDTKSNNYLKCANSQIVTLRYRDNLSLNPENSESIALINGAGREMDDSKTLGILNVLTGTFEALLPQGQAAMTPYYSADGKNLLYASSEKSGGITALSQWLKVKHPIYKINSATKQITQLTQLTNSLNGFDFAPTYLNAKDIVFLRLDSAGDVSLWRLDNGNETKLIDGLIFYNDQYKTQGYYGHFNNSDYLDLK